MNMRLISLFIFTIVICNSVNCKISDKVYVKIKQGIAMGKLMKSVHGKTFNAFIGIPYGKAGRFMSPEPADPWTGIYDATYRENPCMQFDSYTERIVGEEDCLRLNIYSPKLPSLKDFTSLPLAVLVYIHGGRFYYGSASSRSIGPQRLMDYPIVVITLNYRLGSLGFLSTNDEASLGNYGLLDQVLALQWIKDNIKAFGGDANRVTISGQSAGAKSVALHLLSPMSMGLFHQAIAQSGSIIFDIAIQHDPLNISKTLAEKVKCPSNDNNKMVDCLRSVDAYKLLMADSRTLVSTIINQKEMHGPVIENSNKGGRFLTESPLKLLKEKRFYNVPYLSGVMTLEQGERIQLLEQTGLLPEVTDISDTKLDIIIPDLLGINLTYTTEIERIKQEYFKNVNFSNIAAVKFTEVQLSSDFQFVHPTERLVKLLSAGSAPVYAYLFNYSFEGLAKTNYSGKPDATHSQDLFYLFTSSEYQGIANYSREVKEMIENVLNLWTNFVITGNPTPSGPVTWKPVTSNQMQYLNIDINLTMVNGSFSDKVEFWENHSQLICDIIFTYDHCKTLSFHQIF